MACVDFLLFGLEGLDPFVYSNHEDTKNLDALILSQYAMDRVLVIAL